MLKKTLFVGLAVVLLGGLFFGTEAYSYLSTMAHRVHSRVKSNVPIDFEITRARRMIERLEPEIRDNMERVVREEVEVARLEREVQQRETRLAAERRDILRLRDDLETGASHFVYHGRSYTDTQVRTDLENRFANYQRLEDTLEQMEQILAARRAGVQAAKDKLEGMMAAKRQLEVEIENLEARLQMIEVAQTTSDFQFDDSQLSRTRELLDDISTRLEVTEQLMSAPELQLHERIPLDEPEESDDISDTITRYFSDDPVESFAGAVN